MKDFIDSVAGFTITADLFEKYSNESCTLDCLWAGLSMLANQVRSAEVVVAGSFPNDGMTRTGVDLEEFGAINKPLVVCCFHWYATSVCNWARLLGWFRKSVDPSADDPPLYMQAVLPEVYPFRDKVSAHFARTTKPGRDNEAERDASVISALGWDDDVFVLPWGVIFKRSSGKKSDSSAIQPWSITRVHERLIERFGLDIMAEDPPAKPVNEE